MSVVTEYRENSISLHNALWQYERKKFDLTIAEKLARETEIIEFKFKLKEATELLRQEIINCYYAR